jgi:hypothetical protein
MLVFLVLKLILMVVCGELSSPAALLLGRDPQVSIELVSGWESEPAGTIRRTEKSYAPVWK